MSTFIGKILVIVIMCVAVLFLGISTAAFSTAREWPKAFAAEQPKIDALKKKLAALKDEAEIAKKALDDANVALATETKTVNTRLSAIKEANQRDLDKVAAVREQLATATDTAKKTLQEVQAKREQIDQLHQQQAAVDKQAQEFRAHEAQLTDLIRELERVIQTAAKNKSDLHRQPSGKYSAMLR